MTLTDALKAQLDALNAESAKAAEEVGALRPGYEAASRAYGIAKNRLDAIEALISHTHDALFQVDPNARWGE